MQSTSPKLLNSKGDKLALQNVKCLKIGRLFMPKSEKSGRCYDHKMNVCV